MVNQMSFFFNGDKLVERKASVATKVDDKNIFEKISDSIDKLNNNIDSVKHFFSDIKEHGFFHAMFPDFNFSNFVISATKTLFTFTFNHASDIFMIPAVIFLCIYGMIGKNFTTKFIVPFMFIYFCIKIMGSTIL